MKAGQRFQLVAGHLALDFANTLDNRYHEEGSLELLRSYEDLLRFMEESAVLEEAQKRRLLRRVSKVDAAAALAGAIEFREALERIFSAAAEEQHIAGGDLAIVNRRVRDAYGHRCIKNAAGSVEWSWESIAEHADGPLWLVAYAAADLLTSKQLDLVRRCESRDCGWLFLDQSKNHSRRWCDMKICGNRIKARRYYQKNKS